MPKKRKRKFKIKVAKAILGTLGVATGLAPQIAAGLGAGGSGLAGLFGSAGLGAASGVAQGLLGGGDGRGKSKEELEAEERARLLQIQQQQTMAALRLAQFFQGQSSGPHNVGRV